VEVVMPDRVIEQLETDLANFGQGALPDELLSSATGGADKTSYTNTMQMMSNILQMLESTSKSIIGNLR
jgi:hypothetical protein